MGIRRAIDLINYSPLNTVLSLGSGDVDLVEIEVPALLIGRQARELMLAGEVTIAAIVRGNKTFIPTLGTTFEKGDLIYMTVATGSTGRLKRLLGME